MKKPIDLFRPSIINKLLVFLLSVFATREIRGVGAWRRITSSSSPPGCCFQYQHYYQRRCTTGNGHYHHHHHHHHLATTTTIGKKNQQQKNDKFWMLSPKVADGMPRMSQKGVYQIQTEDDYTSLLKANPDKLVIVKYFATYCKACKALAPKFLDVKAMVDKKCKDLPIVWAEFPAQRSNRAVFRRLSVLTLPTVHFYDGSTGLIENFPCGPSKVPLFKKKLANFLEQHVDPNTYKLIKPTEEDSISISFTDDDTISLKPRVEREVLKTEMFTSEHKEFLRSGMPFFEDLTDQEFQTLLQKVKLQTFDAGDVIVRQGMPPKNFYVVKRGKIEMGIRSKFDDPISTPPSYLGAIVKELGDLDYFGERALSTGEPFAASFRVVEKSRVFVFNVDDIPESSILSKKRRATREMVEKLSARYGLPDDYKPTYDLVTARDERALDLLVKFRQMRRVAKCFEYIMQTKPNWGDAGEIARRSVLVRKLPKSQTDEFKEIFDMVDIHNRGKVSLLDLAKFMRIREEDKKETKSHAQILEEMKRINPYYDRGIRFDREFSISLDEFMGVIAEAEFYALFTETFQELDPENTGYVQAGALDDALGTVRDLISNDKTSIIDVEDRDMLVDYEQFSKMLLGAAL